MGRHDVLEPAANGMAMKSRNQRRRERQQRRYKPWFHQYEVEYFIRQEYPGCPEFAVVYFATYVCTEPKNWSVATIAQAVDHIIQCELRHQMTDYDQLMIEGVKPSESRRRVQPKVNAMISSWREASNHQAFDTL
jgi:hypothetical protein